MVGGGGGGSYPVSSHLPTRSRRRVVFGVAEGKGTPCRSLFRTPCRGDGGYQLWGVSAARSAWRYVCVCLGVKGGREGGFPLSTCVDTGEQSVSCLLCEVRKKRQPFTSVCVHARSLLLGLVHWDSEDNVVRL